MTNSEITTKIKSFINGGPQTSGTNYIIRTEVMEEFGKLFPNEFSIKFKGIQNPIKFEVHYSLSGKTRYNEATITRLDALVLTEGCQYKISTKNDYCGLSFSDMGFLTLDGSANGKGSILLSNNVIESIQ